MVSVPNAEGPARIPLNCLRPGGENETNVDVEGGNVQLKLHSHIRQIHKAAGH